MTLVPDKNSGFDNREQDFSQAIVALGLEKARLESECEAKRKEVNNLDSLRADVQKKKEKLEEEIRVLETQHDLKMDDYSKKIVVKQGELNVISQELAKINAEISRKQDLISGLSSQMVELQDQLDKKRQEFNSEINAQNKQLDKISLFARGQFKLLEDTEDQIVKALNKLQETKKEDEQIKASQQAEREALDDKARDLEIWKRRLKPYFNQAFDTEGELSI